MSITLVTGGAGFIGRHSVRALLDAGASVRVFDDLSSGDASALPDHPRLELVVADIRDAPALVQAMRGVGRVLHLAGLVSVQASIEQPAMSAAINRGGFANLLAAAEAAGVRRVVHASSAAVYGTPATLPLREDAALQPLSPYGADKCDNEARASNSPLSVLGLRYFNVYGPGQSPASPYAGVVARFIAQAQAGLAIEIHGDGEQSRDFIHVRDVATANVRALDSDVGGVMNIASGQATTLNQLARLLSEQLQRDMRVRHGAARVGDIRHSCADIGRMQRWLAPELPAITLADGLAGLLAASR